MDIRALVLAGVAVATVEVIRRLVAKRFREPTASSFTGDPNNDKRLVVQGWSGEELRKIVADFTALYQKELPSNFRVEIHSSSNMTETVTFPDDIPPLLFSFLVNYVYYPEHFDLKGRSLRVAGTTTLSKEFPVPDPALLGRKGLFYVPANDQDYDVVYVRVGNDAIFENSFAAQSWKRVDGPRLPSELQNEN